MPTVSLPRKSLIKRPFQEDQFDDFKLNITIISLDSISVSNCPNGYTYAKYEDYIVFHKMLFNDLHVLKVTHCMGVDDKRHVKLFLKGSPFQSPPWFRIEHNCKLSSKSILENFPNYLKSQAEYHCVFEL